MLAMNAMKKRAAFQESSDETMIGKIEKPSGFVDTSSTGVLLNPLEVDWYNIPIDQDRVYVQVQILGVNKEPTKIPLRLFTHIYNRPPKPFLWIPPDFLEAYNLKLGDVIRFHVYPVRSVAEQLQDMKKGGEL